MFLVGQVYLEITGLRCRTQIILSHQTIEIDRAGRPGVGLVIHHFRHLGNFSANLVQDSRRLLKGRAHRHVEDNLELALVVERQHFQHHQLEAR